MNTTLKAFLYTFSVFSLFLALCFIGFLNAILLSLILISGVVIMCFIGLFNLIKLHLEDEEHTLQFTEEQRKFNTEMLKFKLNRGLK
jgi:hypothetical protein